MCPSFRATGDERHLTRGRANTLRLALSGQLGPGALASDALYEAMDLCVGCKGCKRECPTGVDMARMKIEFLHHYHGRHGYRLRDLIVAYLPRYARLAALVAPLLNRRNRHPAAARLMERLTGISARRGLPEWRRDTFLTSVPRARKGPDERGASSEREVMLLVDTFTNAFEPENAHAALRVLEAAGYGVHIARPAGRGRPLCCGRTFLAQGMVNEARREARRMVEALAPYVARGVPVIGLEPSCLYTLRDELRAMLPGPGTDALAGHAMLFEEFLARESAAGRLELRLAPLPEKKALLHGHCHQKAFDGMPAVQNVLALVPELEVQTVETSCCGMAGAFGYEAAHYDVSMRMAEARLMPAVRSVEPGTLIVADGTSCRHQIRDLCAREAIHVARLLERALA
jgi:Fe-S oxidoreductase